MPISKHTTNGSEGTKAWDGVCVGEPTARFAVIDHPSIMPKIDRFRIGENTGDDRSFHMIRT